LNQKINRDTETAMMGYIVGWPLINKLISTVIQKTWHKYLWDNGCRLLHDAIYTAMSQADMFVKHYF